MLLISPFTLSAAGKWNGTVDVAVKTLKDENMSTEEFLGEAALMKVCNVRQARFCAHGWQGLKHANLLTLYAVCTVGFPIFIITGEPPVGMVSDLIFVASWAINIAIGEWVIRRPMSRAGIPVAA